MGSREFSSFGPDRNGRENNRSIKVPAISGAHPKILAELDFGECWTESAWLIPLLSGKSVVDCGCGLGLRAAYLAPETHQMTCTDPDAERLAFARKTLRLNRCRNTKVVRRLSDEAAVDVMMLDSSRYNGSIPPILASKPALLVIFGSLSRIAASEVLGAGYLHLPQFNRAAVFVADRGQHGFQ